MRGFPKNIAQQMKLSLRRPNASAVKKQLQKLNEWGGFPLLWYYVGSDDIHPPRFSEKRSDNIVKAIESKNLFFLSGRGCLSPVVFEQLCVLKALMRDTHHEQSDNSADSETEDAEGSMSE
eukprot:Lithocolla_globosa_v1_NODE_250_length_4845_cov_7.523591.p3 type:complete len:121 gc:universal NODE_250_length_4845_cov_7.523591:3764-4126(+)